jgi:hypothetical protein
MLLKAEYILISQIPHILSLFQLHFRLLRGVLEAIGSEVTDRVYDEKAHDAADHNNKDVEGVVGHFDPVTTFS